MNTLAESPKSRNPLYRRLVLLALSLVLFYGFLRILPHIEDIITVLIISIVLTYAFRPLVDYAEREGISRVVSILGIFAIVIGLLILSLTSLVPILITEVGTLVERLNEIDLAKLQGNVIDWMQQRMPGVMTFLDVNEGQTDQIIQRFRDFSATFLQQSIGVLSGAFSALSLAIVVPFIVFFLLKDGSAFTRSWVRRVPNRFFEMSMSLAHRMDRQLGNYILSVLVESLIVGALAWLAFALVGVRFALILGILSGLLNMIPFFGPLIAWIPTTIVFVLTYQPFGLGLFWMAVVLIGVQMVDNVLLKPLLISRSQSVHPITVLLVVLIGGRVAGPIGMFIAVPFFSIIKVIVVDLYEHLKNYRII
ncbi:MAG: AI-2E family transporter [bacterium]